MEEEDLRYALAFVAASHLAAEEIVAKEFVRSGLRFPLENGDYEVPSELGQELMRLNQEVIDVTILPAHPV